MEYDPDNKDFFKNVKDEDIFTLPTLDTDFGKQRGQLPTDQYNKMLSTFFE